MADRNTGFHPSDADWTKGRAVALADAEATARRQIGEAVGRVIGQIVLGFSFGLGLWLAFRWLQ